MPDALFRLEQTIRERRRADPSSSYVAKLTARGRASMAHWLGVNAVESVIAAIAEDRD